MLALLQQFITLGALTLAALWGVLCWQSGHEAWALLGVGLIVGSYAAVLALEFVFLRLAHGDDPAPRASGLQLLRAWWGEVRSAPLVFCWRQPFFSQRFPNTLQASSGQRGVLLLHGFFCNRGLWNRWQKGLIRRGVPVMALSLEPIFGGIDDYRSAIEEAIAQLHQATGQAPVVVAHSMGGLALRAWWAQMKDDDRVHHAITLGTPHSGTWLARFALTRNAQQMRRASRWLLSLAALEPAGRAAKFTCFYSHCDNIVFPPTTATLPGANNRHLPGVAHVHMVEHPEPWNELLRWVSSPAQRSSGLR
jgi:triacylglycerol lipase